MLWIYILHSRFFQRIPGSRQLALIRISCLHSSCLSSNHSACSSERITTTPPSPCTAIGPPAERESNRIGHELDTGCYAIEQSSNTQRLAHETRLACYMWVRGRRMSRTWEGTTHAAERPDQPRLPLLHAGCVFVVEMSRHACGRSRRELNSGAPLRCRFKPGFHFRRKRKLKALITEQACAVMRTKCPGLTTASASEGSLSQAPAQTPSRDIL